MVKIDFLSRAKQRHSSMRTQTNEEENTKKKKNTNTKQN